MTKRHLLLTCAKVVLVAGLMVWVFWFSIQWGDTVTRVDAAGVTIETIAGRVRGPWDVEVVRFVDERGVETAVRTGAGADGTTTQVSAGFLTYLRNLDLSLFAAGAACYLVTLLFSAMRWWWLLRHIGVELTRLDALRYTWIGVFFNNVVPGQTGGDVVKALYIMKRAGSAGRVAAIVSVIVDRVLGLASLALLGAVVVLFYIDRFAEIATWIWATLIAVGLVGVVAFSKRIRRFVRLDALLRRLPMSHLLERVDRAVHHYRGDMAGVTAWLIAGVGSHCVSICSIMLIGDALGVGMPAVEYFVLVPVINIVSAVPIAPNGWGVGEALYASLFSKFGARHLVGVVDPARVMATRGVALSVLYRIHLTLWSLIGGLFMLAQKERVTRAEVEEEIAREERESLV